MLVFIRFTEKEAYYKSGPDGLVKVRLEEAFGGERCLIIPYQEASMQVIRELAPSAVTMSGFGGYFHSRKIEWFYGCDEIFHHCELPMLCFCGSHQLMAFCLNRDIRRLKELRDQPMRRLKPNEHWPRRPGGDPNYDLSQHFVADGFFPIRRLQDDPLFVGLPKVMTLRCSHYCEVKKLPTGFVRLAESDHCRIEAMRHRTRPVYGTQFHPEAFDQPFFHGKILLANFARIVHQYWQDRS